MKFILACLVMCFSGLVMATPAPVVAPTPHHQGPSWKGRVVDVDGEVIAHGAPYQKNQCVLLRVAPGSKSSGGRVWLCASDLSWSKYPMGSWWSCKGKVTDLRMTHIGEKRRPMPLIVAPVCSKF